MEESSEYKTLKFLLEDDFDLLGDGNQDAERVQVQAPPEIEWFHGKMGRDEAHRILVKEPAGSYLIRESVRNVGDYSISFKCPSGVKHFQIIYDDYGSYHIADMSFNSLADVVEFYCNEYLSEDMTLMHPVRPTNVKAPTLNRVGVAIEDFEASSAEELSIHKGDQLTILNSRHGYWIWVTLRGTHQAGFIPRTAVRELDAKISEREAAAACRLPTAFQRDRWLHGKLSRQEATRILQQRGFVGSFLVRESSSGGDYTLSFMAPNGVQHFKISVTKSGHYEFGGRTFDCLEAIILRYIKDPLSSETRLMGAVPKEDEFEDSMDDYSDVQMSVERMSVSKPEKPRPKQKEEQAFEGMLTKKARKQKKWKAHYFRLDAEKSRLVQYDSLQSIKPRGIIDLNSSALFPLDDSFFGRPNCFLLKVQDSEAYFCADTAADKEAWIRVLAHHCSFAQIGPFLDDQQNHHNITTLKIGVMEVKDVPKLTQGYALVLLNDTTYARTPTLPAKQDAIFWAETFSIDNLAPNVQQIRVNVVSRGKRKDTIVGYTVIDLKDVNPNSEDVAWRSVLSTERNEEIGRIRLQFSLRHHTILPLMTYQPLTTLLLCDDLQAILTISKAVKTEQQELASRLVRIWRSQFQEVILIQNCVRTFVSEASAQGTLFRGNTLLTKLIDEYMKLTAMPFLRTAIEDLVKEVFDEKRSMEMDPTRSNGREAENFLLLDSYVRKFCEKIFSASSQLPSELRSIFQVMRQAVKTKFADSETAADTAVSAFVFLRLIVPATINPKLFNMMPDHPTEIVARNLTLIAKVIQNLANFVDFGVKEPYMGPANKTLHDLFGDMKGFLERISIPGGNKSDIQVKSVTRDLSALTMLIRSHSDDLSAILPQATGSGCHLERALQELDKGIKILS